MKMSLKMKCQKMTQKFLMTNHNNYLKILPKKTTLQKNFSRFFRSIKFKEFENTGRYSKKINVGIKIYRITARKNRRDLHRFF